MAMHHKDYNLMN